MPLTKKPFVALLISVCIAFVLLIAALVLLGNTSHEGQFWGSLLSDFGFLAGGLAFGVAAFGEKEKPRL